MVKIHDKACVEDGAIVGDGTSVWQYCIIKDGAVIGKKCNIGAGCYIENKVSIGDGVKIKNNITLYEGVTVEDDVFLGPNCVFTNVINPRSFIERKKEFKETVVKKGATIGANATIICGNTIGRYAMVGAGSVVTRDVPDHALVVGNPARQCGYVCVCGCRLDEKLNCSTCGKEYIAIDGRMEQKN
jgi:UDP-2-acetamido-3-amino-2,3-dideoxy-glucuronate N-acetyltransferase